MATSCAPADYGCAPEDTGRALPDDVREASGLASSRTHPGVFWTHNDSDGGTAIVAVDVDGAAVGRVELRGAHNRDWEDVAVAPCPPGGPEGDCVFLADIGDNRAARDGIGIWIAAEPDPRRADSPDAVFVRLLYPDGARDAEALAVLDDASLLVISKGRERPITVFRTAALTWPAADAAPIRLDRIQQLSPEPVDLPEQVTGAAAARDRTIAIRSYAWLQFYRFDADTLRPVLDQAVALDSLAEPQGEGVAFGEDDVVYLSSEAGPQAIAPRLTALRCRLPS